MNEIQRIQLVQWTAGEAGRIERAGYAMEYPQAARPAWRRELRPNPPAAVVIDLSRQP